MNVKIGVLVSKTAQEAVIPVHLDFVSAAIRTAIKSIYVVRKGLIFFSHFILNIFKTH